MAKPVHHTLHSPDPAAGKVALNARSAAHYLRLKNRALQLAKAFDLSEASYHQLFEQGLIPLDQFLTRQHGQVAGPAVEAAFAEAARALCFPRRSSAADRFPTIDSILDLASAQLKERLRAGEEDIFAQLIKGGAVVQPVAGMLIQPETGIRMPEGDGRKPAVRFAPKTAQLVTALGRGLIRSHPDPCSSELDAGEVVFRVFVVPGRDGPEVFDLVEEPFDEIAVAV